MADGTDPELVLEVALGYTGLAESITTIDTPEDDAVRVVCAVRDAPGNAHKHLLGAVAAAYDPEAGYDMPGTVIGEIHTPTDAFQWGDPGLGPTVEVGIHLGPEAVPDSRLDGADGIARDDRRVGRFDGLCDPLAECLVGVEDEPGLLRPLSRRRGLGERSPWDSDDSTTGSGPTAPTAGYS